MYRRPRLDGFRIVCAVLGLAVTAAFVSETAFGQIPATSAEPGQVEKRFKKRPKPAAEPRQAPDAAKPHPVQPGLGKPTGPTFLLKRVTFDGMTAIDDDLFRLLYAPLLNKQVTLMDMEALAGQVTAVYRNRGYILSRAIVPQQNISDGNVRILVVEGYVGRTTIQGLPDAPSLPHRMMDKVTAIKPWDAATLERYTLLLNDLPGVEAEAVFSPLTAGLGAAQMQINARQTPIDAVLAIDNRGTRYNGPYQFRAGVGMNSMLRPFDRTYLTCITTDTVDELQLISLDHEQPIDSEGTRLGLSGLYSQQEPGYLLADVDTESESHRLTTRVTHPFFRSRHANVAGRAELSAYRIKTEQMDTVVSREELRTLRLGVTCDRSDQHRGVNTFDLEVSQGLNVLGELRTGSANLSRPRGKSDYTKASVYLARDQYLTPHWSLAVKTSGQLAFSHLLASEEFAYGGREFGRAHDSSELTGDHGLAGSIELRYGDVTPWQHVQRWQAYAYFDAGKVWRKDDSFRNSDDSACDTGVGGRIDVDRKRRCNIELAKPLSHPVASRSDGDRYDWRLFFELIADF